MSAEDSIEAEFRVGRVIDDSFRVLGANFLPFFTLCLLLIAPVYLFIVWSTLSEEIVLLLSPEVYQITIVVAEALLGFIAHAAVVYGTFRQLQGRRAAFGDNVVQGLRKALAVFLVAVVAGLIAMLGFMALVVPGLVVLTIFAVAVPVAVVEGHGVGASLNRSAALTKGCRWRVFGVILVVIVIQAVTDQIVERVLDFEGAFNLSLAIAWLLSGASTALQAVLATVTYHELRMVKEGADVDQIASVFD